MRPRAWLKLGGKKVPARVRASASRPRSPVWCPSPAFPCLAPLAQGSRLGRPLEFLIPGSEGRGRPFPRGAPDGLVRAPCSAAQFPLDCAAAGEPILLPLRAAQRSALRPALPAIGQSCCRAAKCSAAQFPLNCAAGIRPTPMPGGQPPRTFLPSAPLTARWPRCHAVQRSAASSGLRCRHQYALLRGVSIPHAL